MEKNPNESLLIGDIIDYDTKDLEDKYETIQKYFTHIWEYGEELKSHNVNNQQEYSSGIP